MGISWIKLTTNIFDDEKIKIIDTMPDHDAILVIWIKLLTLAGKSNHSGCLYISDSMPYTDEMLAAVFSRPLQTVRMSLDIFEKLGMIERHDAILLVNWEKHQNEAALEVIRERDKDRKRVQREKQKQIATCPGNVSDSPHLDIDKDIELDKDNIIEESTVQASPSPLSTDLSDSSTLFGGSDNGKEEIKDTVPPRVDKKVFRKPTVDEVRAYCTERGNSIDPEYFVNYNESRGWVVGRSPMKSWQATIRTWEKHEKEYTKSKGNTGQTMRNAALGKGIDW